MRLILDLEMFDIPLNNLIEHAHGRDNGTAFANRVDCEQIWGKTLLIGGAPRSQLVYRDLVGQVMEAIGVGMLPEKAFTDMPYSTDWFAVLLVRFAGAVFIM